MSARSITIVLITLSLLFLIAYPLQLVRYAVYAIGLQTFVFIFHGWPYMSEKYYDASGSATHLSLILISLLENPNASRRQIMCSVFGIIWATRLGSFLFQRILRDGKDTRFDKLKKNALTFCTPWAIQKEDSNSISIIDCVAWLLWIFGFVFEVTADAQKFAFRNNAKNHDKFITTGLWAFSQHPNYFGEILMWFAVALSATCAYTKPVHWLGWISPAFTYFLLLKEKDKEITTCTIWSVKFVGCHSNGNVANDYRMSDTKGFRGSHAQKESRC
eukprot:jgi/Bigna1/91805/estExt_fgenesh1_pg.C_1210001